MKPFVGIDITENKKNEEFNGKEFIVAAPSAVQSEALDRATLNTMNQIEKAKLPTAVRLICLLCGFVGGVGTIGIFRALLDDDSVTLKQAYQNAAWLFWLAGISLVAWGIITIFARKKAKEVLESNETDNAVADLNTIVQSIYAELGVPLEAEDVDVLSFSYKIKDGEPVAKTVGMDTTPYDNFNYKIFAANGNLYLADREAKYEFPMTGLRSIRTVNKSVAVPSWNKEDAEYNAGRYKAYKIKADNNENISFKPYHILELAYNGEIWGIYFPCYELHVFESLTGLKAEQK